MAGLLLRHRRPVAAAAAAAALVMVETARLATGDGAGDGWPWLSIAAVAYGGATSGLFAYLRTDRAREAFDDATDSSLAAAQVTLALSPTVVAIALHLAGAAPWVMWLVVAATVVQLLVWSGIPKRRGRPSGD